MAKHVSQALLEWYLAAGIDEAVGDEPISRFAPEPAISAQTPPAAIPSAVLPPAASRPVASKRLMAVGSAEAIEAARIAAGSAETLEALRDAVTAFEYCALKQTATNTVFADGNPTASVMMVGEAPGGDEDRIGRPFVGVSGKLLDRMLATIGLDRNSVYITNILFWRPPGNRKPTELEISMCLPFVEQHVALVKPKLLVLVGGTASGALLPVSGGITKTRGRWISLKISKLADPVKTIAMYHPSFLLRSPERKQEAWSDLLSIKSMLKQIAD